MTRSGAMALAQKLRDLSRYRDEELLPQIAADYSGSGGLNASAVDFINEAQVRQYLLDPLLDALGWRAATAERMLIEAPAGAGNQTRRFLDYLGRSSFDAAGDALLIVEAKRLSLRLPTVVLGSQTEGVAQAIREFDLPNSKLSEEWKEILRTLRDYVRRVGAKSATSGRPKRVLLANGSWFVLLLRPLEALEQHLVGADDLFVAADWEEASRRAGVLFDNLAFERLADRETAHNCHDIQQFLEDASATIPVALSIEVRTVALGDIRPVMSLGVVAHAKVREGVWVRLFDEVYRHDPILLRKEAELIQDMAELRQRGEGLLKSLRDHCAIRLVAPAEIARDLSAESPKPISARLADLDGYGKFLLHVGEAALLFLDSSEFDGCPYHDHGASKREGVAATDAPILRSSSALRSYFSSGSPLHCTNRLVHSAREDRCAILPFESFACCRRCSLQRECWPEGLDRLPCKGF